MAAYGAHLPGSAEETADGRGFTKKLFLRHDRNRQKLTAQPHTYWTTSSTTPDSIAGYAC